ncbi:MAG: GumC family protein [bacterium]
MADKNVPSNPNAEGGDNNLPEIRLELTQAGVRQVMSLYAEEQAGRGQHGGISFGIDELFLALQKHWRAVVMCVLAGVMLSIMVLTFTSPLYTVTAQVVLERQDPSEARAAPVNTSSAFIATQAEVMQSRSVLAGAVELTQLEHPDPDQDELDSAQESIQASAVSGTQVVALSYLGLDPVYGMELLEATVTAYRNRLQQEEIDNQNQRLNAKQGEYEALLEDIQRLEEQLDSLRRNNFNGGSAEDAVAAQLQIIRDQTQRLGSVRQNRIALETQLLTGSTSSALNDNPVTRSLQDRLVLAEAELARTRQTLRSGHPTVEAAQREVDLLRNQLTRTEQATPLLISKEIEAAKALEEQLIAVLNQEREILAQADRLRREERMVTEELNQTQALVDERRRALLDQRLLKRLADAGEFGITARMIAEPVQPQSPTWPNPLLVFILCCGLGGLIGVCWAIFKSRQYFDPWASDLNDSPT